MSHARAAHNAGHRDAMQRAVKPGLRRCVETVEGRERGVVPACVVRTKLQTFTRELRMVRCCSPDERRQVRSALILHGIKTRIRP